MPTPAAQLASFLAKFDPPVAALARACLKRVRQLAPGSIELVYDAYNALAIGFATGERLSDGFIHVAVYPEHVNIGFNRSTELDDPARLLEGTGNKIRHVRIENRAQLANPDLEKLIRAAAKDAPGGRGRIVIKAIYERRRPRRPGEGR